MLIEGKTTPGGGQDAYVRRYRPDGSIDRSFGASGTLQIVNSNGTIVGSHGDIRADAQGNLYVAGAAVGVVNGKFAGFGLAVARITASGRLDTTYGTGGIANAGRVMGNFDAMYVHEDGRVLLVGTKPAYVDRPDGTRADTFTGVGVRFTAAGQVDKSFAGGQFTAPELR